MSDYTPIMIITCIYFITPHVRLQNPTKTNNNLHSYITKIIINISSRHIQLSGIGFLIRGTGTCVK